jgi:L-asparaginase/Glu-tRNA(Gln) amidotransferase subunit D
VQVAWRGTLHPARSVRKVDAAADDPFANAGQLHLGGSPPEPGPVVETGVRLLKVGPLPRPEIPGDLAGLVLEGTGAAHVPSCYHRVIEELVASGVPSSWPAVAATSSATRKAKLARSTPAT